MNYFPRIALVLLVQALWLAGYGQKKHKETTIDLENNVEVLKNELTRKLFSKEYGYLWEPADAAGSAAQTRDLAGRSYRAHRGIMNYFIQQHWDDDIYVLLIGGLYFFWVWYNFRVIERKPGQTIADGENPEPEVDMHLRYLALAWVCKASSITWSQASY